MDRNVGDYTHGQDEDVFDPAKEGFSYGTYIHGQELTGILQFDIGVVHAPFTWEINARALGPQYTYWAPVTCGQCNTEDIRERDLDGDVFVGWRGPAISIDKLPYLPTKIQLYRTWWDDYGVSKTGNWYDFTQKSV